MDRATIVAQARAAVATQREYQEDQAQKQWNVERGQLRAAAVVLELSRIDDETLSPRALLEARAIRQLSKDTASYGQLGPAYGTGNLPLYLVGGPEAKDPTTQSKVVFLTGKSSRSLAPSRPGKSLTTKDPLGGGGGATTAATLLLGTADVPSKQVAVSSLQRSSPSTRLARQQQRQRQRLPRDPYWKHLEKQPQAEPLPGEVEDRDAGCRVDRSKDPMTLVEQVKKQLKSAADPNATSLRLAQQYLRLVYGPDYGLLESEKGAGGGGGAGAGAGAREGERSAVETAKKKKKRARTVGVVGGVVTAGAAAAGRVGRVNGDARAKTATSAVATSPGTPALSPHAGSSGSSSDGAGGGALRFATTAAKAGVGEEVKVQQETTARRKSISFDLLEAPPFNGTELPPPFTPTQQGGPVSCAGPGLTPASPGNDSLAWTDERDRGHFASDVESLGEGSLTLSVSVSAGAERGDNAPPSSSSAVAGAGASLSKENKETFSERLAREARSAKKAVERANAQEARKCLVCALQASDCERVLDLLVSKEEKQTEERKLRFMKVEEKAKYVAAKAWKRAKDIVDEREVQRVRIRRACHELWLLELHQKRPVAASESMRKWLDMAQGEAESLGCLSALHESLSAHELLLGSHFSAATHSGYGSLGELGDLHLKVLQRLRDALPHEPHYMYALSRLEAKRLDPVLEVEAAGVGVGSSSSSSSHALGKHLMTLFADADPAVATRIEQRRFTKSQGYYSAKAMERAQRAVEACADVRAVSHWQVDVREERQALDDRDDFVVGCEPSDKGFNSNKPCHRSAATTTHTLPPGGWLDSDFENRKGLDDPSARPRQNGLRPRGLAAGADGGGGGGGESVPGVPSLWLSRHPINLRGPHLGHGRDLSEPRVMASQPLTSKRPLTTQTPAARTLLLEANHAAQASAEDNAGGGRGGDNGGGGGGSGVAMVTGGGASSGIVSGGGSLRSLDVGEQEGRVLASHCSEGHALAATFPGPSSTSPGRHRSAFMLPLQSTTPDGDSFGESHRSSSSAPFADPYTSSSSSSSSVAVGAFPLPPPSPVSNPRPRSTLDSSASAAAGGAPSFNYGDPVFEALPVQATRPPRHRGEAPLVEGVTAGLLPSPHRIHASPLDRRRSDRVSGSSTPFNGCGRGEGVGRSGSGVEGNQLGLEDGGERLHSLGSVGLSTSLSELSINSGGGGDGDGGGSYDVPPPRTPSRSAVASRVSTAAALKATALPLQSSSAGSLPLAYPRRLQPRAVDYENSRLYDA